METPPPPTREQLEQDVADLAGECFVLELENRKKERERRE